MGGYVVAAPCIWTKCYLCVQVCPVNCFYEDARQLYISDECIDCGACEPECPVGAIFPEDDLPTQWRRYLELNVEKSATSAPVTPQYVDELRLDERIPVAGRERQNRRDALMVEIRRSLESTQPDSAEDLMHRVERWFPVTSSPAEPVDPEAMEQVMDALAVSFPERARFMFDEIRALIPLPGRN